MRFNFFNGDELLMMLVGSANLLAQHREEIDRLNIFPVPDGDTGTNMHLTFLAGVRKAKEQTGGSVGEIAAAMAQGSLLGARGNSGVILSQILHGFSKVLEGKDRASTRDVASAFHEGAQSAWQAVMNPVEGTILTVCRRIADSFQESVSREYDLVKAALHAYRQAQQVLVQTPEMLPELKEAGVVDAGGKGLVVILEGILHALRMTAAKKELELFDLATSQQKEFIARSGDLSSTLEYMYCTEMIVIGKDVPLETLRHELCPYGDCLMVVGNDRNVKVHIHSNHPGLVLECCLKYGALHSVQINNMEAQHRESQFFNEAQKNIGVISVGSGEGIANIMESLGADAVVSGGQTMNPSTETVIEAIEKVRAHTIILLPNNSNVLMTAHQAASLTKKEVRVIQTISMPQGIAALLAYIPNGEVESVVEKMTRAAGKVRYGEVTKAVRDTTTNGQSIKAGEYIAVQEDAIIAAATDVYQVLCPLVELLAKQAEIVTLYYGAGLSGEDAKLIGQRLSEEYEELEVDVQYGGQPHYQFIVSAE